jgi:hypothetical protein
VEKERCKTIEIWSLTCVFQVCLTYEDLSVSFELVLLVDISLLVLFHVFELVETLLSSGVMLTLLSTFQTKTNVRI